MAGKGTKGPGMDISMDIEESVIVGVNVRTQLTGSLRMQQLCSSI